MEQLSKICLQFKSIQTNIGFHLADELHWAADFGQQLEPSAGLLSGHNLPTGISIEPAGEPAEKVESTAAKVNAILVQASL